MLKKIIKRPVLATVISILLLILGFVSMQSLPITMFPDIAPPTVMVTATYPGASAEVLSKSVAPPLENAINGVENMDYMTATASNDGTLAINIIFKLGTDPDQAAVNVQNKVSQATSMLPAEVNQIGVTTLKRQNSQVAIIALYGVEEGIDAVFVENYAKINIVPELKRIPGVGDAMVYGNRDYAMRVWMDPQKMAAYEITPAEISAAIQAQNMNVAPGKFGESSKEAVEYTILYKGKYTEPEQYQNIVVRANSDGSSLLLKDVAKVELGGYTATMISTFRGHPAVMMAVFQTAGSNANEMQIAIEKKLGELATSLPPGVKYEIPYNTKNSLDQSIEQVIHTLIEAFILVFIVVYIFLQDFRSTLIPAIAVPVSIVGTFFFMQLFGFSINLLTLFALVLAIGIVVDDAIVVVEAVHAKMEKRKLNARAATMSAMGEITGAIISITLVMSAVFLPVGFMDGPTGVFYQQFAMTLAIAILISALNALTLSPALCALLLKGHHDNDQSKEKTTLKERFFAGFNAGFDKVTNRYVKSILFFAKRKSVAFAGLALFIGLFIYAFRSTPTGFIPDEDQSFVMILANNRPGSSLDRTSADIKMAENLLEKNPAVEAILNLSGFDAMSNSTSPSAGVLFVRLKAMKERGDVKDINSVIGGIQASFGQLNQTTFFVASMPTVPGFGNTSGLDLVLQDRNGGYWTAFNDITSSFSAALMARPEVAFAFSAFNASHPQMEMKVNEELAKQLNLDVSDVLNTMQAYYGSIQASDFNRFGKYYRVVLQSDPMFRTDPKSIEGISVKNKLGQMVPLKSVVELTSVSGPESVDHFNLFNSINVSIVPAPGYSTGQAMAAIKEVASSNLPQGYAIDWKGMAREEQNASGQTAMIFVLSILFVYFLLAAQYESYILPFAVLLAVPTGLLGVFLGISIGGLNNNIYVQVAMIMLIGLLAKNAILIVEFARQRRKSGKSLVGAAIEGAKARFRPILMTSFAFIAGLLPLLIATGPSAIGNHSIGYAAVFGMLAGTALGVFFTPILYVVFQYIQEFVSGREVDPNEWEYAGDISNTI